jgi:hypothetical protein
MTSPYSDLPARSFWKGAVSRRSPETVSGLWHPKFSFARETRIATAGSCFAQHIARYLRARKAIVVNLERSPPGLSAANAAKYGYGIYSARYGNIYTVRHLLQLTEEALGRFAPSDAVWERDGRFFDAMRIGVEPAGLPSAEAVRQHRLQHLGRVQSLFARADVFVFTLGLTEAWTHRESGTVYPTAPGTIAGSYRPDVHAFRNFDFLEVYEDFVAFRRLAMEQNPGMKFLLTVSPVPLAATATDQHVLVATTYSKSALRAAAGKLAETFENVDYFPSFDFLTGAFTRGAFHSDDARQITQAGVEAVMRIFFEAQPALAQAAATDAAGGRVGERDETGAGGRAPGSPAPAAVCEDILLDAFSR